MLRRPPPVARHTVFRGARSARTPGTAVAGNKRARVSIALGTREPEGGECVPRRVRINASRSPRTFDGMYGCGRTRVSPSALALRALVARCVTKGRGAGKYLKIDFPRQNRETFTSRRALIGGEPEFARETLQSWHLRKGIGLADAWQTLENRVRCLVVFPACLLIQRNAVSKIKNNTILPCPSPKSKCDLLHFEKYLQCPPVVWGVRTLYRPTDSAKNRRLRKNLTLRR